MKEWKNIIYKALNCNLIFTEKGDYLYVDKEYYSLWIATNNNKQIKKLNELGFKLFDRNIFYLEISDEEAQGIILEQEKK